MIGKPELRLHATIDTDSQRVKENDSKVQEVFLRTVIEIPPSQEISHSSITFTPVKTGRPEDLHLYVHAKDPSLMREKIEEKRT